MKILPSETRSLSGLKDNDIRQEALKRSWDLETLRREGMKMESTGREGQEINGEDVYKMGAYSFKSQKNKQNKKDDADIIQQDKALRATTVEKPSMDK